MKAGITALLAACLATAGAAQASNIVINGGFESNSIGSAPWSYLSSVTGWTSTGPFEIQKGSDFGGLSVFNTAYEGHQYLELNSTTLTQISQTLHTTPGSEYNLSFAFSGRTDTPGKLKSAVEIYWNGQKLATSKAASSSDWIEFSFEGLKATGLNTVLSFKSIGPGAAASYGSLLDGVNVSPVPEPDTMIMMAGGLALLGFLARRRKAGAAS